jgi:branched-chain amino acid transport system ATP-binding protein
MLAAEGARVRFGGLVAVDGVSLDVEEGRVAGLIGPNGAGKTTLLDVLSGRLPPSEGRVTLEGRDVTALGLSRRARLGVARSFQRLELFRNLTVFENLLVGAEARFGEADFVVDLVGRSRRGAADALARRVLERVGLEDVAGRWADEVPLGIGRLVEIGRALCTEPRFLLLDEPAGGLDDDETDRLAAVLTDVVAEDGIGVLLVEHDLEMVMGVCDHVTVMDFGRTIASGSAREVRDDPAVRDAYLGVGDGEVTGAGAARGA